MSEESGITIRPSGKEDEVGILDLAQSVAQAGDSYTWEDASDEELRAYWLPSAKRCIETYVAIAPGVQGVAGVYIVHPNRDGRGSHIAHCAYIISPAARGRGLAKTLCKHSLSTAKASGYSAIQFNMVVATNVAAVRAWLACGFRVIGTLPKVFRHKKEGIVDAHVMFRELDDITESEGRKRQAASPLAGVAKRATLELISWKPEDGAFTDFLKSAVSETWEAAKHHPMTDAIAVGRVPKPAMRRYLIQDHKFLDAFVVLLSSMIACAPTLEDRIPGAQFLGLITGKENTYFERSFAALDVSREVRDQAPAAVTAAFIQLMRDTAAGKHLAEMLSVLIVAEWSYLEWAERVAPARGPDIPFWCGEWIDLHSGGGFAGVVSYLRRLLDRLAPTLLPQERAGAKAKFSRAIELEKAFWDMAWGDSAEG